MLKNNEFPLTVDEIVSVLGCEQISAGEGKEIKGVSIDSRKAKGGDLFFALHGERSDGHDYISDISDTVSCCIIDRLDSVIENAALKKSCAVLKVSDTLVSLQKLAKYYRSKFSDIKIIGITGSSGKTTTKEMVAKVLAFSAPTVMNEGNLNSEIGLPLSVFNIRKYHRYGVFEMGMNHPGEMDILVDILNPDFGILTNIGTAHIGLLGSQDRIAEEKSKIFLRSSRLESGLIYGKDKYAEKIASLTGNRVRMYDEDNAEGLVRIENEGIRGSILRFDEGEIRINLIGFHNILNAIAAVETGRYFSVDFNKIKKALEAVSPLFGRGEIREGSVTVISECYNSNLEAVLSAVDFLKNLEWEGRKVILIGSILELGDSTGEIHRKIGEKISASLIDGAFFYGKDTEPAYRIAESSGGGIYAYYTSDEKMLVRKLNEYLKEGDIILFKGSRGMALERFIEPVLNPDRGILNA